MTWATLKAEIKKLNDDESLTREQYDARYKALWDQFQTDED